MKKKTNKTVNLSSFSNSEWNIGASKFKQLLWLICSFLFFQNPLFIFYKPKQILLKIFGAKIGLNLIIKPSVKIKFPWKLIIGDNCWIGEDVWIDNLDYVRISNNVCISQGAYLLTGNHNYNKEQFDLITKPIIIKNGVWIAAKSILLPGSICLENSIVGVGCVFGGKAEINMIYQNQKPSSVKKRKIKF